MLSAVTREPGLRPAQLAAQVGISERTLRRDVRRLRGLGYDIRYRDGYQLWEGLAFDGAGAGASGLELSLRRLVAVLERELPTALAAPVVRDVEALIPAALASLMASAIEHQADSR
ncbi:MAG TPA: HTH domain-containing protein [Candidatus Nitrosotalea sp.]|nr:HTH domain-containing protein [Candidatus Nitrosotalea sp.]